MRCRSSFRDFVSAIKTWTFFTEIVSVRVCGCADLYPMIERINLLTETSPGEIAVGQGEKNNNDHNNNENKK